MAQLEITFTTGEKVLFPEDTPIETFDRDGNFVDRHTIFKGSDNTFTISVNNITENVHTFVNDETGETYYASDVVNFTTI